MGRKKSQPNYHVVANTNKRTSLLGQTSFIPTFFNNQYNDEDYDIFEDVWSNTPAGKAIDLTSMLTIGKGFRPKFELTDPELKNATDEEKQKALKEYDKELNQLIRIDKLSTVQLKPKAKDMLTNAQVFGRSLLAFEPGEGKPVLALKSIHPREIGRVFTHPLDWSLSSVRVFQKGDLIHDNEMIYMVNMPFSPRRRSMHYGYSDLQRSVGPARAWRQIFEFDLIEIVTSIWAKYGLLTVDNEGLSADEKKQDMEIIREGLKPGAFNIINGKKDEFNFFPLDTDPKVGDIDIIIDRIEREMFANVDVPGALMGREEESNMATLLGKLRMFTAGPIAMKREWLEDTLRKQWYEYNLSFINPEILEHVEVKVEFEPIIFESWSDNVDALSKLKLIIPELPSSEILKLAQLEDLTDKLDTSESIFSQTNSPALKTLQENTNNTELKNKLNQIQATLNNKKK